VAQVELEVPPRSVYVGVVRLAISALGRSLELDEDSIEDLKIAVSEACANAVIQHEEAGLDDHVRIVWDDDPARVQIEVRSAGRGPLDEGGEALTPTGSLASRDVLSLALLQSLVDECVVEQLPGGGSVTRLTVAAN
jgi:serine/threonine-protein kinase RsbW